jgi:predicted ATPase
MISQIGRNCSYTEYVMNWQTKRTGNMQPTRWNVITGAPSSGKTAVIDELFRRGYRVVPEVARALIDRELDRGRTLQEIKSDIHWFERTILMEKVRIEADLSTGETVFLDRAIPDSIAYYQIEGLDPAEAQAETGRRRYRRVFLLDRLDFRADGVRSENNRKAQLIEDLLGSAYRRLAYPVIRVPVLPVQERADWILKRI